MYLLLIFLTFQTMGKPSSQEELKAAAKEASTPIDKAVAYVKLAEYFGSRDLSAMEEYLDSASAIPEYVQRVDKSLKLQYLRATLLAKQGHMDSARVHFIDLLPVAMEQPVLDTFLVSSTHHKLGDILKRLGKNNEAIKHLNQSRDWDLAQGDTYSAASSEVQLGIIHKNLKQYELAIGFYQSAYDVYQEIPNYDNMATCLLNIANVKSRQKKYEEAEELFVQSLSLADSVPDNAGLLAFIYGNLGNLNTQLDRFAKGLFYSEKSYELRKETAGAEEKIQVLFGMAVNLRKLDRTAEAMERLNQASALVQEHPGLLEAGMRINKYRSQIHKDNGDTGQALAELEKYIEVKDSFQKLEIEKQALDLSTKYETEQKENRIDLLNSEKALAENQLQSARFKTYGSLAAALIFGSLLIFVFSLLKKTRTQNTIIATALTQKEILIREIHHRVKNNLQFISSLLGLQTEHIADPVALDALQEGQDRVQSMALIHQDLYQEDNLTGVDVNTYFKKLFQGLFDSYNIRGDRIQLEQDINDLNLDVDSVIPLGLIVNELVSNSLKYAFPDGQHGKIMVKLSEEEGTLKLIVSDNGVGMSDQARNELGSSFGYRLIQVLQSQLDATLEIESGPGTTIKLGIQKFEKARKTQNYV